MFWSGRSGSVQDAYRAASKLAGIPEFANFLALSGAREPPEPGAEIVLHVIGVIRRRDDTSHGGLGKNIFEEQLRPAFAVEFGGPIRKGASANTAEQFALLEGLIGDVETEPGPNQ